MATARFVDIIERNGERLQSLIEDLMELSRLESKEFRLKKEDVDLGVVASIVLGLFRERADKKGVKIQVAVDGDARTSSPTSARSSRSSPTWSTTPSSTARRARP